MVLDLVLAKIKKKGPCKRFRFVFLNRFEKLSIPSLQPHIEEIYGDLLQHFGKEVEVIAKVNLILFSFERNCMLRWLESETLKIN